MTGYLPAPPRKISAGAYGVEFVTLFLLFKTQHRRISQ